MEKLIRFMAKKVDTAKKVTKAVGKKKLARVAKVAARVAGG